MHLLRHWIDEARSMGIHSDQSVRNSSVNMKKTSISHVEAVTVWQRRRRCVLLQQISTQGKKKLCCFSEEHF
ncbi:uncharacterized protein PHALS_14898 [Plasmopara halstedii]|uniref:Uncharacterized protein n=1 Tax=Plasmopara halstedii TaxID=4781 RepID=A0A0N7L796_PLAHL|nr:uncharacterized protein PHALS_14898 [Plasmopara halstedii]CEG46459.1 hypothetical protein PHALS_14898 [Plasmopara halstedii]|eukprot:XP_024582828.1 hypothetical protein PHALS_14898 [Plasmopara halstedii]